VPSDPGTQNGFNYGRRLGNGAKGSAGYSDSSGGDVGAIRIIWPGDTRSYPSTDLSYQQS
jgi:hypothetical protein